MKAIFAGGLFFATWRRKNETQQSAELRPDFTSVGDKQKSAERSNRKESSHTRANFFQNWQTTGGVLCCPGESEEGMNTSEQDFDSGIEEKQPVHQMAKQSPEAHPFRYGQGRVKPDPETNPRALLDWKEWALLGHAPWFWSE
jgi:hypothetical protein